MFSETLLAQARDLLNKAFAARLHLATAESCTGGLLAGLFTEIDGASEVFDRGFVTYSNDAKEDMLGVPKNLIADTGAVSESVARAMAKGAILCSSSDLSVAITGIAGPGGGSEEKPVGLVYIAAARTGVQLKIVSREFRFGDIGRGAVRQAGLGEALTLLDSLL